VISCSCFHKDNLLTHYLQHIGYPIANDPFYGPNSLLTGRGAAEEIADVRLGPEFTEECQKVKFTKLTALPDHPWSDAKCPECWIDFSDPLAEDMRIDLHAWKYEGPGWKFETELPLWAKDLKLLEALTVPSQTASDVDTAVGLLPDA
jgi:hypothetical protein